MNWRLLVEENRFPPGWPRQWALSCGSCGEAILLAVRLAPTPLSKP